MTRVPRGRDQRPRHRGETRRRRSRVGALATAVTLSMVIAAAALGLFPGLPGDQVLRVDAHRTSFGGPGLEAVVLATKVEGATADSLRATGSEPADTSAEPAVSTADSALEATDDPAVPVPAASGSGRRVVFSQSLQRVWLVAAGERVQDSYAVSGSAHDNLRPGRYAVFTRARRITAYDYASQLAYFVGFFRGRNAIIGFHDIPVGNDGTLLQTAAELGTPLSSGCIRQLRADAIKLWEFAPVGTTVVVVA